MSVNQPQSYTIPAVSVTPVERIPIISLGKSVGVQERNGVIAALLSNLHGEVTSDQQVVSLIISLVVVALPETLAQVLSSKTVKFDNNQLTFAQAMELTGGDGRNKMDKKLLPVPEAAHPEAIAISSTVALYSGVALVIFSTGRQARETSPDAITTNRPKALISKYSILPSDQVIFPGREHGPSVKTLERAFNAFGVYTEPRMQVIRTLLGFQQSSEHYPVHLDAVMTQFRLMRFAGMTHVGAITKLVQAHPWTVRVPKLEPYFRIFCTHLSRFNTLPEQLRPYHRLLASPADYLFLTSELRPLVAVAGSFLKDVEATFKDYVYNEDDYRELIEEVKSRRPGYEPVQNLALMAAQLGLEEIPRLPPRQAANLTPDEEE